MKFGNHIASLAVTTLVFGAACVVGCEQKTPAEKAQDNMGKAADNVKDASHDAADSTRDATHKAADKVRDATK